MDKRINFKFVIIVLSFLILSLYYILAVTLPPTAITFGGNITHSYDEGAFTINWTDGGQNVTANYTFHLWMNNQHVLGPADGFNANDSVRGYTWDNATEANYTFTIAAVNISGNTGANATNVSMYIDSTPPLVNWTNSGYNNITYKKNNETLTVNISVGDALSGVGSGNSYCVFEVNSTNETVAVSDGWCNTTQLNLTGLADGNQTINVWANDSVNNVGLNLSTYVVWIDTTAPATPTFSCTPTSVYVTETITCSCLGTDASSGVNTTSYTVNPPTSSIGTFTPTCTTEDYAGNTASATTTYVVSVNPGGSSGTTSSWTSTYVITDEQFKQGFTKELKVKNRIKVRIENADHHVGVKEITSDSATIEITSEPVEIILNIGEEVKVDVTEDDYYDIYLLLNSLSNEGANVTIQEINEEIPEGESAVSTIGEETETPQNGEEQQGGKENLWWIWIIVAVVVIAVGVGWKKVSKR